MHQETWSSYLLSSSSTIQLATSAIMCVAIYEKVIYSHEEYIEKGNVCLHGPSLQGYSARL